MNTYDMLLYWQNKCLIMEKEVRKAQKGIARLKRREKYLKGCIDSNNKISDLVLTANTCNSDHQNHITNLSIDMLG